MAVSVYVVDIDEDDVENVASDGTGNEMLKIFPKDFFLSSQTVLSTFILVDYFSSFPKLSSLHLRNTAWLLAQKGRSWGAGRSLKHDVGRKPYKVGDSHPDCPKWAAEGKCDTDIWDVRLKCLRSCKIYIEDERYYSEFGDPEAHHWQAN